MDEIFENYIMIKAEESGERVDALLVRNFPQHSRNQLHKLLEMGNVTLNQKPLKKSYRCSLGEEYELVLPQVEDIPLIPQNIPLDIVYEDADVIVVNKPRGLVVHPGAGHPDGTLVNALLYHCGDSLSGIGGVKRPGIVHRIDKDTSGLLIVAKNDFAHQGLSAQLSDHSLCREYEAIVHGHFKEPEGTINKPIGRHPVDRKRMAVTEKNSKPAVTHWQLLHSYKDYSHILCRLETGRTHQIRVHMSSIGHPLLADYTYGARCPDKGLVGQCLHARRLRFVHPRTQELICLETPLPEYFLQVISRLGAEI